MLLIRFVIGILIGMHNQMIMTSNFIIFEKCLKSISTIEDFEEVWRNMLDDFYLQKQYMDRYDA